MSNKRKNVELLSAQKQFNDSIWNWCSTHKYTPIYSNPPNKAFNSDSLDVDKFYVKPVIYLAPDHNFPGLTIPCNEPTCSGHYTNKGHAQDRVIHGLNSEVFLLQCNYQCSLGKKCTNSQKQYSSFELVKTNRCPEYVSTAYKNQIYLSHNSGVTTDLLTTILNLCQGKHLKKFSLEWKPLGNSSI